MTLPILAIILSCLCILGASLGGILFMQKHLMAWMHRSMNYLVSFSAGVFFIIAINIALETFSDGSILLGIGSVLFGVLIAYAIESFVPDCYHHHDECHEHHSHATAYRVLLGDALHNIADGFLLAPAFFLDFRLGIFTAASIFIHEFVQGISEFFVLKESGYSTSQALWRNCLANTTVFIGAGLGIILSQAVSFLTPLLGIAAGLFLYMIFMDLVPRSIRVSREEKKYLRYLLAALLGVMMIVGIAALSGQSALEETIHESLTML
ncbi:MAG: ZIP family metal transporter [Patescibacteria group bacterium]|jgi:zinc and cadmium transporter